MAIRKLLSSLFGYASDSFLFARFVAGSAGKQYGIGRVRKAKLATTIRLNHRKIPSLSPWQHHLLMVEEIMTVPVNLKGDVVECGCYCGASTASLSLACALTGRKLIVCDLFQGLPKPAADEVYDIRADFQDYFLWEESEFGSEGGVAGVKSNVAKFGSIEACQFVEGYFADSLPDLETESVVFVFEDADLKSSVKDCLSYLWAKLQEGCRFYCDEPWSIAVVGLFYDEEWWETNLNSTPLCSLAQERES